MHGGVEPPSSISRFAPSLRHLLGYQREWLRPDLLAGVSVAAVAIPTAIAYAQLIGFEPIVGLHAAILPLVAYAVFGTSRQLIVNPDAATCAVFAATVIPLAGGDAGKLSSLAVALAVATGLISIAAGILRLGVIADFLAKPILVGYLNGVAISIFLGQIGKLFGPGSCCPDRPPMEHASEFLHTYPALSLFLTIVLGYLIGRVHVKGIGFGNVVGTLLAGIVIGIAARPELPELLRWCFFYLFLFSIGYSVGPQFFGSLKKEALPPDRVRRRRRRDRSRDRHHGGAALRLR